MAIVIDSRLCTGCKVCLDSCPPQAISREVAGNVLEIIADYSRCDGCGDCQEKCPEKAISVDKTVKSTGRETLYRGIMAEYPSCGRYFAPAALITKFQQVLARRDAFVSDSIRVCPECKDANIERKMFQI